MALAALSTVAALAGCRTERAERGEVVGREEVALPGVEASRIRYGSVDVHGDPSVVGALVALPAGSPPPGGWPVVAYAHATTGAGDRCDPSQDPALGGVGAAIGELAGAGFVAVATDYEGIGSRGGHPYLHGGSEAQAVVDAVLAARTLVPGTSDRWAVVGHSQGGHAALFSAQRAADLAPELALVGAVAVAPAADPASLLATGGAPSAVLLVHGWLTADDDAEADGLLTDEGDDLLDDVDDVCTVELGTTVLAPGAGDQGFDAYLAGNVAGQEPAGAPVLVVQGGADELTPPEVAQGVADRLCALGSTVELRSYPAADHSTVVEAAAGDVLAWLAARFAGEAPTSTC